MTPDPLDSLVGHELTAVVFAVDHLALVFGDLRLDCHVWPLVDAGETERSFGDDGYRDDLCLLLGSAVRATRASFLQGLVLDLGVGRVIVDPEPADLVDDRIATLLTPGGGHTWTTSTPPFDERVWG